MGKGIFYYINITFKVGSVKQNTKRKYCKSTMVQQIAYLI